ncbi:energy transducer TonB [Aurantiacibacter gangjinensis]|uniref:energy transducer TonB n=1 Tax=Aurantiacibacter gangjinensis TaxID=502682 RepID=UPI00090CCD12|nr:energy transducer TonB [Aurantiacibacter gangjinensis]APE29233.1 Ferric siderophore transport system, periplasmic binding protein TonB [Aurantiacibacter gangjinensis]
MPLEQAQWARRIIENYPSRALRQEQEGRVQFTVTVGTNGRVNACRITKSSGFPILDDAACRGMERYARFEPALDRSGNPVEGSWSTAVVYAIN